MAEKILVDVAPPVVIVRRRSRIAIAFVVLLALCVVAGAILAFAMPPDGKTRDDTWRFVGRLHPALVHLPIGAVALVPLMELVGSVRRWRHVREAAGFVLGIGAVGSVVAVGLGYSLARADGNAGETVNFHMYAGLATALLAVVTLGLRGRAVRLGRALPGLVYLVSLVLLLAAMSVAGHLGGQLTYGENYYAEVAPPSIKRFLGPIDGDAVPAPPVAKPSPAPASQPSTRPTSSAPLTSSTPLTLPEPTTRPTSATPALPTTSPITTMPATPTTQLVEAAIAPAPAAGASFARDVRPVLAETCVSCHGPAKIKGGLRVDSFAELMKGGDAGESVIAGNAATSELYRRMTLPMDDDEVMPPSNAKKRPTAEQIAAVKAWIDGGAKDD